MKQMLIVPIIVAGLAGCASNKDVDPQVGDACSKLSGAALSDCQKNVQPASQELKEPFKMVKPKPVNGRSKGSHESAH